MNPSLVLLLLDNPLFDFRGDEEVLMMCDDDDDANILD